jgi:hypothetical protein
MAARARVRALGSGRAGRRARDSRARCRRSGLGSRLECRTTPSRSTPPLLGAVPVDSRPPVPSATSAGKSFPNIVGEALAGAAPSTPRHLLHEGGPTFRPPHLVGRDYG